MSRIHPYASDYRPRVSPYLRDPHKPRPEPRSEPTELRHDALGMAGGAAMGALAGCQPPVLGALMAGATGLTGGFAAGYLAGSTIARQMGGNRTVRNLAGLGVGASTACLAYPGAALLASTAASPATAVALAVVGGVGGYLMAHQLNRHV